MEIQPRFYFYLFCRPFVSSNTKVWSCIDTNDNSAGNPWGCHIIISLGYLVALAITVPMGYFNLDDNMIVQVVAFGLTVSCWIMWLVASFFSDTFSSAEWSLPPITSGTPYSSQVRFGILVDVFKHYCKTVIGTS